MQKIKLLVGPAGSGKTTLANQLSEYQHALNITDRDIVKGFDSYINELTTMVVLDPVEQLSNLFVLQDLFSGQTYTAVPKMGAQFIIPTPAVVACYQGTAESLPEEITNDPQIEIIPCTHQVETGREPLRADESIVTEKIFRQWLVGLFMGSNLLSNKAAVEEAVSLANDVIRFAKANNVLNPNLKEA